MIRRSRCGGIDAHLFPIPSWRLFVDAGLVAAPSDGNVLVLAHGFERGSTASWSLRSP